MKAYNLRYFCTIIIMACCASALAEESRVPEGATASPLIRSGLADATVREPGFPLKNADPCTDPEWQPNSMAPTWNRQAGTVQCGALETDNVASLQPMDGGVSQWMVGTTAKYGLTPRLELRWGLPGRMFQRGSGTQHLAGTTDQWLGALYHFRNQGGSIPDLALDYGIKVPTANPAKGFGSGYSDHVLTFIASRDVGPNHLDFNVVGILAGGPGGHDGAAQSGLGFSRIFAHSLMGTVEAFGGPEPGTPERYGAIFLGGSWGIRPWLALNGGCIAHSRRALRARSIWRASSTQQDRGSHRLEVRVLAASWGADGHGVACRTARYIDILAAQLISEGERSRCRH